MYAIMLKRNDFELYVIINSLLQIYMSLMPFDFSSVNVMIGCS